MRYITFILFWTFVFVSGATLRWLARGPILGLALWILMPATLGFSGFAGIISLSFYATAGLILADFVSLQWSTKALAFWTDWAEAVNRFRSDIMRV